MNRFCEPLVVFVLVFLMEFGDVVRADESEAVLAADDTQLRSMLFDAMEVLQKKASGTSGYGVYEIVNYYQVGTPRPKPDVWEISVNGENCLKVSRTEGLVEGLEIANKNYVFVLTRPRKPEDAKFSLVGVQKRGIKLSDDLAIREKINLARHYLLDGYSYYGRTVWGLVRDLGFKITKISSFKDDTGLALVRVEFDYAPVNKQFEGVRDIDDWTLKGAYLVFAPSELWTLVEYGRPQYPRNVVTNHNHPEDQLGFTESAIGTSSKNAAIREESTIRCLRASYEAIPESHFYLSHYGFPEPNFGTPSRWPWIVAGFTLSVICIIASRRLLRRLA